MCPLPCSLLFLLSLAIFYFIVSSSSVAVVDRTMSLCRRSLLFPACRTAEVLRGLKTKGEWLWRTGSLEMEKKNTKTEGQAHMQINHAQQIEKLLRVEGCSSQTTYVHKSILSGGVSNFKAIFIWLPPLLFISFFTLFWKYSSISRSNGCMYIQ